MASLSVLLVEDDLDLAKTVLAYLELESMTCDYANNGSQGLQLALDNAYQVILLDINLPRMDGLDVCQALRQQGISTPVLMLTARDTIDDKLLGFESGTDDYLVKPFDLDELVARIKALSKRRSAQVRKLMYQDLVLDLDSKTVTREGVQLKLTPTGFAILEVLLRRSPHVISGKELAQAVWDEPPDSNALKVHLHRLRHSVDKPFETPLIHTIPNQGFALRADK